MIGEALAAVQQSLPEQGDFTNYVQAVWRSRELVQMWVLLSSGVLGMAGNYLFKFLRDDIRGSLCNYLFRDHPKSTALAFFVLCGWALTATVGGLVQGAGWTAVINLGLTTGFAIDALVNKANQAVWTPEERAAKRDEISTAANGIKKQEGFAQLQLVGWIAAFIAFVGYTGAIYHEGGRAPRAELERFKTEVAAAQAVHAAEDAAKAAQSKTIIQEKDHEREKALADSNAGWTAALARVRAERDSVAKQGAEPARAAPRVCDGADGNSRLSDALEKAERDTRAAVADYKAGVGELLVVAEQQALDWDNLKQAVAGLRALNTRTPPQH